MTYTVGFYDRETEHFVFKDYPTERRFLAMWRHYEKSGLTFKLMEVKPDQMLFMAK